MYKELTSNEFENEIKKNPNAVIIDVRTPAEYQSGHIPNALNIDISSAEFPEKIDELDRNKDYYVYCRNGGRSTTACQYMVSVGFKNVNNLFGGVLSYEGELV
ncbi:MAG TPA: rhodanese-like domain-containing protein [Bacteroidia bacterium]|nr:rhodanese-like domain-containing protein [Bacteroidia bacterium]